MAQACEFRLLNRSVPNPYQRNGGTNPRDERNTDHRPRHTHTGTPPATRQEGDDHRTRQRPQREHGTQGEERDTARPTNNRGTNTHPTETTERPQRDEEKNRASTRHTPREARTQGTRRTERARRTRNTHRTRPLNQATEPTRNTPTNERAEPTRRPRARGRHTAEGHSRRPECKGARGFFRAGRSPLPLSRRIGCGTLSGRRQSATRIGSEGRGRPAPGSAISAGDGKLGERKADRIQANLR
jgi:hypothetical protein